MRPPALTAPALSKLAPLKSALAGPSARAWAATAGGLLARQARAEWHGSALHRLLLSRPRPEGLGVAPRDFRPVRPQTGRAILAGVYDLGGAVLETGARDDPWNRPSPSLAFAVELHRFGWLPDLIAVDDAGPRAALRLVLEWERVFGRWNGFAWSGEVIERRVFNLACAMRRIAALASEAERVTLTRSLARQARHLASLPQTLDRAAERAAAAAVAGASLYGDAADRLTEKGQARLVRLLPVVVLPDGGHASRSAQAGLQLLFDLLTFDDALLQLGRAPPEELVRAMDRLTAALRFLTLPDGRLACFQGGEEGDAADVSAARAHDDGEGEAPVQLPHCGYEKLVRGDLMVIVDAAPPAGGAWSLTACAHPLALEVMVGRDRIITNTGWSTRAPGAQPLRLTAGGSTAQVADASAGAPLKGLRARALGSRLIGGVEWVDVRRHAAETGDWLEMSHDGWSTPFGLTHQRRLFMGADGEELRGEDRFIPVAGGRHPNLPFTVRFHLHPDIKVSLARDQRSILLQTPTQGGWWLRNDAPEVAIEPSVHLLHGHARRTSQVVLHSRVRGDRGGRVRWKLARVEPEQP